MTTINVDEAWGWLLWLVVMLAVLLGCTFIWMAVTADHSIKYYYTQVSQETNAVCVWGFRPWYTDTRMYCSDDQSKVADFLQKMRGDKK